MHNNAANNSIISLLHAIEAQLCYFVLYVLMDFRRLDMPRLPSCLADQPDMTAQI